MGYALNADVALEFKSIDFTNGAVQGATVDTWCSQASAFIDGYLGGKYTVPIDPTASPNSYAVCKMLCVQMVAFRVRKVIAATTGDTKSSQGSSTDLVWPKDVIDTLKQYQSGAMKLNDALIATSADGAESYSTDNPSDCFPQFTREGDDW